MGRSSEKITLRTSAKSIRAKSVNQRQVIRSFTAYK